MSQKFKIFGSKFMVEEELRALQQAALKNIGSWRFGSGVFWSFLAKNWSELVANAVVVLDYEETGEEEISQEAKSSICQS